MLYSEPEVWDAMARAWDKPERSCEGRYAVRMLLLPDGSIGLVMGLCTYIHELRYNGKIAEETYRSMMEKISLMQPPAVPKHWPYYWPVDKPEGPVQRAEFCRRMAQLSREEQANVVQ